MILEQAGDIAHFFWTWMKGPILRASSRQRSSFSHRYLAANRFWTTAMAKINRSWSASPDELKQFQILRPLNMLRLIPRHAGHIRAPSKRW